MVYNFLTDNQIRRATGQFMRALSGFQVSDGPEDSGETKRVPIVYGEMDRVVAQLIGNKEQLQSKYTLPMMACNLSQIEVDNEQRKPRKHYDAMYDGEIGEDVLYRISGTPLVLNFELAILCSSNTELFQLLEQILLIFNPRVTINVDDKKENASYITEIHLESISPETNWPIGSGTQARGVNMSFKVPFRLKYPHDYVQGIIKEITQRVIDDNNGEEIQVNVIDGDSV